jgi:DNA-binding transcriptional LysR family regulator
MADRRLQVFHAVSKQLSFTKAAEALFMTQPAVTFQIKQLEEHCNARLFDRGHGKVALTSAGEIVLEYAEKILNLSDELDQRLAEMTGEVAGSLHIGASMTIAEYLLPRILGEFKSQYPGVRPRMSVANSETIESRVAEHAIDMGFIESPPHAPGLDTEDCCDDELQVICGADHSLAKHKQLTPKQLLAYPFVSCEPGSGTREFTDKYFRDQNVAPDGIVVIMELGSPQALKGAVETGLGYAIVSRLASAKEKQLADLVSIPLQPKLIRKLSVVYPRQRFRSRVVTAFAEFATLRMREMAAK